MQPWAGLGEAELDGVCFRFASDLALISFERKIYSIAEFLHHCCTIHGVAEIDFANHQLIPKTYPVDRVLQNLCFASVRPFWFVFVSYAFFLSGGCCC